MSTRMATAAPISGQRVLMTTFMRSVAYVASPISRLVCLEVVEALRPALRQWPSIAVMRIKSVIDMSVKSVRAVKPWACSKKHSAHKPIRPVITIRSTVIRGIVEVSVRANWSRSDFYANCNLGLRRGCTAQKASYENCENKHADFEHDVPFLRSEFQLAHLGPA
jgi:hypothetical protein